MSSPPRRAEAARAAVLAACVLTTGCGYHLRGSAALQTPPPTLRLAPAGAAAELASTVSRALAKQGFWRQVAAADAACVLELGDYRQRRQPLELAYVLDAPEESYARVAGYQLAGELRFSLRAREDAPPLAAGMLQALRDYTFPADIDRPTARSTEEEELWRELHEELAQQVRRRIERHAADCTGTAGQDAVGRDGTGALR